MSCELIKDDKKFVLLAVGSEDPRTEWSDDAIKDFEIVDFMYVCYYGVLDMDAPALASEIREKVQRFREDNYKVFVHLDLHRYSCKLLYDALQNDAISWIFNSECGGGWIVNEPQKTVKTKLSQDGFRSKLGSLRTLIHKLFTVFCC